jgi:acetolactate synthase-1/2/3 large subunit
VSRSGGRILVDQLALHGADLAFGVPGESYIDALDALRDSPVRFVTCRHEGGAATMAEAYGKLTGAPGVCFVTRGPGATQASVGVHTAYQDGTPLLLLVGQIPREDAEREAFQEIDYRRMFGPLAKWVAQVDQVERIPELTARAFRVATSGGHGPVVLAPPGGRPRGMRGRAGCCPMRLHRRLADLAGRPGLPAGAERPRGSSAANRGAAAAGSRLPHGATRAASPSRRPGGSRDYIDNARCYAGHSPRRRRPALPRPPQTPTCCWSSARVSARHRDRRLHDHRPAGRRPRADPSPPDPDEIRGLRASRSGSSHPGHGSPRSSARLGRSARARGFSTRPGARRYRATLERRGRSRAGRDDGVMEALRARLGPDAILTSGAGNFTVWAHRFYVFRRFRTQLAPLSGAMGYVLPAAIAAKLVHPDRDVVCLAGDGDFLMTAQELATARQAGAPVVVLVVDNGMYGTIRMHQERRFPGRPSGTDLANPDFVALAQAFGAYAERVERTADLPDALDRALGAGTAALLHLPVDPEALTPRQTLSEIRSEAGVERARDDAARSSTAP